MIVLSILQEYAQIKRTIGEEKYARIMKYLKENPSILYSDVMYKEKAWKKFVEWEKANYENPIATNYEMEQTYPGLPF